MPTGEFKVNSLSPGIGEKLHALGEVIRTGRSLSVSRVTIWTSQGADQTRCAEALVTMMTLAERDDR
jgi:acyl-coenzyme A thioesterase PaaI-like protein